MAIQNPIIVSGRTFAQFQVGKFFVYTSSSPPGDYRSEWVLNTYGKLVQVIQGGPPRFEGQLYLQKNNTLICSIWVGINVADIGDPNYDENNGSVVDLRWRKVSLTGQIFSSKTGLPLNNGRTVDYRSSGY